MEEDLAEVVELEADLAEEDSVVAAEPVADLAEERAVRQVGSAGGVE